MAEADAVEIELQRQAVAGDHGGGQRIVGPLDEADIAEGDAAGLTLQGGCDGIVLEHEQAVERGLVGGQSCPAADIDKADGVVFLQGGKPLLNVAQPVAQGWARGTGRAQARVLMNSPTMLSEPARSAERPDTVRPNIGSRPDPWRSSSSAQAADATTLSVT